MVSLDVCTKTVLNQTKHSRPLGAVEAASISLLNWFTINVLTGFHFHCPNINCCKTPQNDSRAKLLAVIPCTLCEPILLLLWE